MKKKNRIPKPGDLWHYIDNVRGSDIQEDQSIDLVISVVPLKNASPPVEGVWSVTVLDGSRKHRISMYTNSVYEETDSILLGEFK